MSPAQLALFRPQQALNNLRRDLSHQKSAANTAFFLFQCTRNPKYEELYRVHSKQVTSLSQEIEDYTRGDD